MDPPQRPRNAQQKISSAEWESHFETIRKLFLTDGYTLENVRGIMEREHQFHATVAQYKKKTKAWKIEKNIPQRKIIPMVRKQDRRLVEGKQTTYIFRGQPVSNEKLERARKRFEKETAEHHPDSPVPATPSDIEYFTPRSPASELDIGSPGPSHTSVDSVLRMDSAESQPTSPTSTDTLTPVSGSPTALFVPTTISRTGTAVPFTPASSSSPKPVVEEPAKYSPLQQSRSVTPTASTVIHWPENSWSQWEYSETSREGWRSSSAPGGAHGTMSRSPSTTPPAINTNALAKLANAVHPPANHKGGDHAEIATFPPTMRAPIVPKPRWHQLRRGTQPRWWFSRIPSPLRDEMPTSLRLPDKDRKDILEDLAHKLAEQVQHDAKDSIGALMKLVDLGNAVADLGRAKDAVQYYNQALEGFEKILGNDLHPIPDVFMNLATVYYEQREYENAVQYHRRSLTGYAKASDQETGHWRIIFQS